MSLSRLGLRLAAIEALNPFATVASGPWPTVAGPRVYDSRIDPIAAAQTIDALSAAIQALESKPIVSIYTEEQTTEPAAGEYPADVEIVDLVAQIQIGARGAIDVDAADGSIETVGGSSIPATDGDAEAILDMLEAQVRMILDPGALTPTNALFRSVAVERHHIGSTPERQPERAVRLAMRTLKLKLRVRRTAWPPYATGSASTGLDALPEPLRTVAKGLDPMSAAAQRCVKLAALVRAPITLTPLDELRLNTNVDRTSPPTDPGGSDADAIGDVVFAYEGAIPSLDYTDPADSQYIGSVT